MKSGIAAAKQTMYHIAVFFPPKKTCGRLQQVFWLRFIRARILPDCSVAYLRARPLYSSGGLFRNFTGFPVRIAWAITARPFMLFFVNRCYYKAHSGGLSITCRGDLLVKFMFL